MKRPSSAGSSNIPLSRKRRRGGARASFDPLHARTLSGFFGSSHGIPQLLKRGHPLSGSIAWVVTGSGQCMDGREINIGPGLQLPPARERNCDCRAGCGREAAPQASPQQRQVDLQIALPMVNAPNITVTYMARPRPRTHSGSATCAETLRAGHSGDPGGACDEAGQNRGRWMVRESEQCRGERGAQSVAAATRESAPSFSLSRRKMNAPPTAAAPMAPSSTPYSAGPPAICVRATSGRSAQYALPNTKNAVVRIRVARRWVLYRA